MKIILKNYKKKNALYVLGVKTNLYLVKKIVDLEKIVLFNSKSCYVFDKDNLRVIYFLAISAKNKFNMLKKSQMIFSMATLLSRKDGIIQIVNTTIEKIIALKIPHLLKEIICLLHKRISHLNYQS